MRGLIVPEQDEDFTADPVELFFDLAYVYAFSELAVRLIEDPTWSGAAKALLLFVVLWFGWSTFAWAANAVSGNDRKVRAIFLLATITALPMGVSIETAFESGGATFAISSSLIVLMSSGLNLAASEAGTEHYRAVLRFAIPSLLAITLTIIGGFLDGDARIILWVASLVVLLLATIRAGGQQWTFRPGHFSERHGLIVLIALGEVIAGIGLSISSSLIGDEALSGRLVVGLVGAGVLAALMWWSYFARLAPALAHVAEGLVGKEGSRFGRDTYTYSHVPIVAGIITAAAATEHILLNVGEPIPVEFLVMFVVGNALYFVGTTLAAYRGFGVVAFERILLIFVVAIVALISGTWSGLAFLLVVDLVLISTLFVESRLIKESRRDLA